MKEMIEQTIETLEWMLADIDFRNEGTGINHDDSPEIQVARILLLQWQMILESL